MGTGADIAWGHDGDDTIRAGAAGRDTLHGGAGNDVLDSSGGNGEDLLSGGTGDDTMTGGDCNDVFVFERNAGHDVITDFSNGSDRMDLVRVGTSFAALNGAGAFSGDATTTVIDLSKIGGVGSITLDGFALADLDAADFLF